PGTSRRRRRSVGHRPTRRPTCRRIPAARPGRPRRSAPAPTEFATRPWPWRCLLLGPLDRDRYGFFSILAGYTLVRDARGHSESHPRPPYEDSRVLVEPDERVDRLDRRRWKRLPQRLGRVVVDGRPPEIQEDTGPAEPPELDQAGVADARPGKVEQIQMLESP